MKWYRNDKAAVAVVIRRIRRHRQREMGSALVVLSVAGGGARLLLGRGARRAWCCPARESPAHLSQTYSPDSPTSFLLSKCPVQKI
jgi:hypothetical protein